MPVASISACNGSNLAIQPVRVIAVFPPGGSVAQVAHVLAEHINARERVRLSWSRTAAVINLSHARLRGLLDDER